MSWRSERETVQPRLKTVAWERDGEQLRVVYDIRDHFLLPDPDGRVEALLTLLAQGGRTVPELAGALADGGDPVPVDEVDAAVQLLDDAGLLEDDTRSGWLDPDQRERYFSNLAFFESFASLGRGREEFQQALREAHVLVLGTGGLSANLIPHLCGLGVGRLTLLDKDVVELRNFARQYLYRHRDLGARKVELAAEWVREFDPAVKVEALDAEVDGPERVGQLLDEYRPDVLMAAIDTPPEVDSWVNDGCVSRGIPYVRGGMWLTQGVVWSVDPGVSACRTCTQGQDPGPATADGQPDGERAAMELFETRPFTNPGIGPAVGLLGALYAFEALRYLTRFESPAYAGNPVFIDFRSGCATWQDDPWLRDPDCPACGSIVAGATLTRPEGGDTA